MRIWCNAIFVAIRKRAIPSICNASRAVGLIWQEKMLHRLRWGVSLPSRSRLGGRGKGLGAKLRYDPNMESIERNNPDLCDVIERNLQTFAELRDRAQRRRSVQERLADAITDISGRMAFVWFHVLWFALWVAMNTGHLPGVKPFDPYPFNFLTMVVSLEAIFLSTFVLISQNRISAEADRRADLDLQIGLLTERELTQALRMLDAIQEKLGIENDTNSELQEMESDVRPEAVLNEIDRLSHERRQKAE